MKKDFYAKDWKNYLPRPVCEAHPEYNELYDRAWELARDHVKTLEGMPQSPYMDEGFCDTQVWIWDTCFMTLFCKFAPEVFPGVETFNNFYDVLYMGGELPEVIPTEDEPWWTGAKPGVPFRVKVHIADNPPLFAWAEYENALIHGDREYVKKLLEGNALQRHYEWIESLTEAVHPKGVQLPTYLKHEKYGYTWEGGSSGMDNTPRGRESVPSPERPNNPDMLWLDAICQQALSADSIARLYALIGDGEGERKWRERFEEKREIIDRYYWDSEDGFYYDVDRRDMSLIRVMTVASYWALTAGAASKEQAAALAKRVWEEDTMGGPLPLLSLARKDPEFDPMGRYWRGALWLPCAYAALKGLDRYGYHAETHASACKIVEHMWRTYRDHEPHTIWECYAPDYYEPATTTDGGMKVRKDFCGWSALGPISVYLEYVLGFRGVDAFKREVEWIRPTEMEGEIGVRNLRFGDVVTDIVAKDGVCRITANAPYTLKINGQIFAIEAGESEIVLS